MQFRISFSTIHKMLAQVKNKEDLIICIGDQPLYTPVGLKTEEEGTGSEVDFTQQLVESASFANFKINKSEGVFNFTSPSHYFSVDSKHRS
mmetsp:Transcript_39337/g.60131  ORF Transcript_39337/g.60131 Transcript_39337/m.60131 type:complete len:91 (+) Transcript_39337:13-285(+)